MTHETPDANPPARLGMAPMVAPLGTSDSDSSWTRRKPRPPVRARNWTSRASRLTLIAIFSFTSYFAFSRYVVEAVQIVGQSMEPTLHEHSRYLVNRGAFRHACPRHRDVVVIRDPEDQGLSVKRVIAVAGDSIHFKRGKVYVNNRELNEVYLPEHTYTWTYTRAQEKLIVCGRDQYFVLGDNRQVSIDSRVYGPVPKQNILGRLMGK